MAKIIIVNFVFPFLYLSPYSRSSLPEHNSQQVTPSLNLLVIVTAS